MTQAAFQIESIPVPRFDPYARRWVWDCDPPRNRSYWQTVSCGKRDPLVEEYRALWLAGVIFPPLVVCPSIFAPIIDGTHRYCAARETRGQIKTVPAAICATLGAARLLINDIHRAGGPRIYFRSWLESQGERNGICRSTA